MTRSAPPSLAVACTSAFAVVLGAAPLRAQPANFQLLGPGSRALSVAANGSTVVCVGGCWRVGSGWIELSGIPGAPGWPQPRAASWDGGVIGGGFGPGGPFGLEAARWTAAGIALQGFPSGFNRSEIVGLSADGQIAVGETWGPTGSPCPSFPTQGLLECRAFRQGQPGGQLHKLPPLPGFNSSKATGVSGDGSTVVGVSFNAECFFGISDPHTCRWVGGGPAEPLGIPGTVSGVSDDGGTIVGTAAAVAFRWTQSGGMEPIGVLPGFTTSSATAVSADGRWIVGYSSRPQGDAAAFIWDPIHGLRELRTVLADEYGLHIAAPVLQEPTGISGDGRTVVGNNQFSQGFSSEAWIAFLGDAVCYPDCNADGALTVADFGCFQTKFVASDSYADCNADASLTVADFGCFQTGFVAGCP